MKRKHASIIIALLIAGVGLWQTVEKRLELQCYVFQQASIYRQAYDQGYARRDGIRKLVWQDILAEFGGQSWRAPLDNVFHEVIMGGTRADQVVRQVRFPLDPNPDMSCDGFILWSIIDGRASDIIWNYRQDAGIESMYEISLDLGEIPKEELVHYSVVAESVLSKTIWDDAVMVSTTQTRFLGEVSARQWLNGIYAPDVWSRWYVNWREDRQGALRTVRR